MIRHDRALLIFHPLSHAHKAEDGNRIERGDFFFLRGKSRPKFLDRIVGRGTRGLRFFERAQACEYRLDEKLFHAVDESRHALIERGPRHDALRIRCRRFFRQVGEPNLSASYVTDNLPQ